MSAEPIIVRASSADRLWACPRSIEPPEVPIALAPAPEASLGTAAHHALAAVVTGRAIDHDGMRNLADAFDVDGAELDRLVEYGQQAWDEIKDRFPNPETELAAEKPLGPGGAICRGHTDVLDRTAEEWAKARIVGDWKGGWRSDAGMCEHQMRSYCWVNAAGTVIVIWLRERAYDVYQWTREELTEWAAQLEHRALHPGEYPYAPGDACRFCPRIHECPALQSMHRNMIHLISAGAGALAVMPQEVVRAHEAAGMIEKRIKTFKAACKAQLNSGIPIRGDDAELVLEANPRDYIDVRAAWPVLTSWFTEEQLGELVTTTKGKLKAAAVKYAAGGTKTATTKKLLGELQSAGAIDRRHGEPKLVRKAIKSGE